MQAIADPAADTRARIESEIRAYNVNRAALAQSVRRNKLVYASAVCGATAAATVALAVSNASWAPKVIGIVLVVGFLGAIMAWSHAAAPGEQAQQDLRNRILPVLFGEIESIRYVNGEAPRSFEHLRPESVGYFTTSKFGDVISGRIGDSFIELFEATLTYKAGKTEQTAFKGIVVAFENPRPFAGALVAVKPEWKLVQTVRDAFASLTRMHTGNPALDARYEIRTDNPLSAGPLVQGAFAEALGRLAATWKDDLPRVALSGPVGFLLLPTLKDFFELPSISVELDYDSHIAPLRGDLQMLLSAASELRGALPA